MEESVVGFAGFLLENEHDCKYINNNNETFYLDTFYDSYEKFPGQENDEFEYNYTEIINFINNYKVEPIKIGRPKIVK